MRPLSNLLLLFCTTWHHPASVPRTIVHTYTKQTNRQWKKKWVPDKINERNIDEHYFYSNNFFTLCIFFSRFSHEVVVVFDMLSVYPCHVGGFFAGKCDCAVLIVWYLSVRCNIIPFYPDLNWNKIEKIASLLSARMLSWLFIWCQA